MPRFDDPALVAAYNFTQEDYCRRIEPVRDPRLVPVIHSTMCPENGLRSCSQLAIAFYNDTSDTDIMEIICSVKGVQVGYAAAADFFQIEVPSRTLNESQEIAGMLLNYSQVRYVNFNGIVARITSDVPED